MKKVLIVTTISGFVPQFEMNNVSILKSLGYEVHYATNYYNPFYGNDNLRLEGTGIIQHQIDFVRSPFLIRDNFKAYKQLRKVIRDIKPDVLHCHTPMGGVLARLAAKKEKVKTVLYTAHGFHFYNGAPLINWLLYFPVEYFLSNYTDILITINSEDYKRAVKWFKAGLVQYVPGAGIDVEKIKNTEVNFHEKRKSIGLSSNDIVICSVGELNSNKNHEVIIRALNCLNNNNVHYIICGKGDNEDHLRTVIKSLELSDRVTLLGYRNDVIEILKISDIFAFPSKREGLGLSALEAMACGLPLVTSNIHGICDYSIDGISGFTNKPNDIDGFERSLKILIENKMLREKIKKNNINEVEKFDKNNCINIMSKVYSIC